MRALVVWRGGLFLTEGVIGVLSVSSLFLTRVGVYVGVSVCILYEHTHTHTAHMGYSDVSLSPGVGRHSEGPEESRWTKFRHICICICVQSIHLYVYTRRRDEILDQLLFSFNIFFLSTKKSKRCERKPPIISNLK